MPKNSPAKFEKISAVNLQMKQKRRKKSYHEVQLEKNLGKSNN